MPPEENLDPALPSSERELAERLSSGRPVPGPEFRGVLRRRLVAADPGWGPRPDRLRITAGLYMAAGGALIVIGALQALGKL